MSEKVSDKKLVMEERIVIEQFTIQVDCPDNLHFLSLPGSQHPIPVRQYRRWASTLFIFTRNCALNTEFHCFIYHVDYHGFYSNAGMWLPPGGWRCCSLVLCSTSHTPSYDRCPIYQHWLLSFFQQVKLFPDKITLGAGVLICIRVHTLLNDPAMAVISYSWIMLKVCHQPRKLDMTIFFPSSKSWPNQLNDHAVRRIIWINKWIGIKLLHQ